MSYVIELLDAVKAAHAMPSYYRLAKVMGIRPNVISEFRSWRRFPDSQAMARLSELSGRPLGEVVLAVGVERILRDEGAPPAFVTLRQQLRAAWVDQAAA